MWRGSTLHSLSLSFSFSGSDFGVSVYTLLTVGLNQRLGLNCSTFSCIIDQTVANAAAGLHPLNMLEAEAIPEQDSWRFQVGTIV